MRLAGNICRNRKILEEKLQDKLVYFLLICRTLVQILRLTIKFPRNYILLRKVH